MSRIATSPLPALIRHYERIKSDPNQAIADFGFSCQKVSFVVAIEPDGSLHAVQDVREEHNGKRVLKELLVPGQSKPSGQGINPRFLWDNAQYMLGFKPEDDDPKRTTECYEAFRQMHLESEAEIGDEAFSAVCRFFKRWNPCEATEQPVLVELGVGFGVFRLRGHAEYVHNRPAVLDYWNRRLAEEANEDQVFGMSLVTGNVEPLARIHEPKIKGVAGAQSSGAVLIGFNDTAYESYGKTQGYNAPVGVRDAFRYTTALNRLLADYSRRVRIGDATVVFWADCAESTGVEEVVAAFFGEESPKDEDVESGKMVGRVREFIRAAQQGRIVDEVNNPEAAFYVLGLSPNAARVNVRFWIASTVGEFASRLAQHVQDLEMVGAREHAPPLAIRRLLWETAREPKDIPPQLAGELARSVLGGLPYPQMLFNAVVRRIRIDPRTTDWQANHRRAAILKAYLIRNRKENVPVALNKDHPEEVYQLGRLFAALAKTQSDAHKVLNSTIRDRYFGAASATPAIVFPQLLRLHQHHIKKMEGGLRVNREKLIDEICGRIGSFPTHLTLEQQGLFYIAYYHQHQDFFTKKNDAKKDDTKKEITNE